MIAINYHIGGNLHTDLLDKFMEILQKLDAHIYVVGKDGRTEVRTAQSEDNSIIRYYLVQESVLIDYPYLHLYLTGEEIDDFDILEEFLRKHSLSFKRINENSEEINLCEGFVWNADIDKYYPFLQTDADEWAPKLFTLNTVKKAIENYGSIEKWEEVLKGQYTIPDFKIIK